MKELYKLVIFIISIIAAQVLEFALPDSPLQNPSKHHYFSILLWVILGAYILWLIVNYLKTKKWNLYNAPLYAGVVTFLNVLNIVTAKYALLPTLYFPTLNQVFGTLIEDRELIIKCIGYSLGILSAGVIGGLVIGLFDIKIGKCIYHRYLGMVPDHSAYIKRYFKCKEFISRGCINPRFKRI